MRTLIVFEAGTRLIVGRRVAAVKIADIDWRPACNTRRSFLQALGGSRAALDISDARRRCNGGRRLGITLAIEG